MEGMTWIFEAQLCRRRPGFDAVYYIEEIIKDLPSADNKTACMGSFFERNLKNIIKESRL